MHVPNIEILNFANRVVCASREHTMTERKDGCDLIFTFDSSIANIAVHYDTDFELVYQVTLSLAGTSISYTYIYDPDDGLEDEWRKLVDWCIVACGSGADDSI